jgi:hypothetical protein
MPLRAQYEESLIAKTFTFEFINSFSSFFYIAFVAKYFNDCGSDDTSCMELLSINLATVFGTRLIFGNLQVF